MTTLLFPFVQHGPRSLNLPAGLGVGVPSQDYDLTPAHLDLLGARWTHNWTYGPTYAHPNAHPNIGLINADSDLWSAETGPPSGSHTPCPTLTLPTSAPTTPTPPAQPSSTTNQTATTPKTTATNTHLPSSPKQPLAGSLNTVPSSASAAPSAPMPGPGSKTISTLADPCRGPGSAAWHFHIYPFAEHCCCPRHGHAYVTDTFKCQVDAMLRWVSDHGNKPVVISETNAVVTTPDDQIKVLRLCADILTRHPQIVAIAWFCARYIVGPSVRFTHNYRHEFPHTWLLDRHLQPTAIGHEFRRITHETP